MLQQLAGILGEKELLGVRTKDEAETEIAAFYDKYVQEKHPCKDPSGQPLWNFKAPLYELHVDNVPLPGGARPLTVNLLELLEETLTDEDGNDRKEVDTSRLKYLLMAILEEGQRHDGVLGHGYDKPSLDKHPCARRSKTNEIYCPVSYTHLTLPTIYSV